MLTRRTGYLALRPEGDPEVPDASRALERDGFAVLPAVFSAEEVRALAAEIDAVFDSVGPDVRSTRVADGHFEPRWPSVRSPTRRSFG
jgi:hypothetical protein